MSPQSATASAKWGLDNEVQSFCAEHTITHHLEMALHLIEECFPYVREVSLEVVADPEIDEQWVQIGLEIPGSAESFLGDYERYTRELVCRVPWPERNKIRVSYSIA